MEFSSTNLAHNISHGLFHEKGYNVAEAHIDKIFYFTMFGVASILKDIKSKDRPATFVITDIKANPIASATVEYFENEDKDKPGNWSLVWSFDPEDIPNNALQVNLHDENTHSYFRIIAGEKWGMKFYDSTAIVNLITYSIEQLYKWLDENAKEDQTVEIELDGVFTAKVQVEDGKKIFALDPAGEVKTIIKDDAAIDDTVANNNVIVK